MKRRRTFRIETDAALGAGRALRGLPPFGQVETGAALNNRATAHRYTAGGSNPLVPSIAAVNSRRNRPALSSSRACRRDFIRLILEIGGEVVFHVAQEKGFPGKTDHHTAAIFGKRRASMRPILAVPAALGDGRIGRWTDGCLFLQ